MTPEDWFELGHVERLEPGQEPTAETRGGSRSTTPQQQGYWEHWGKLGERRGRVSFTAASAANEHSQEFKGQSWPLYCTCPKER